MNITKKSFREHTIFQPESGCWFWKGKYSRPESYGHLIFKEKLWAAHRLAYMLFKGPLKNLCVCHKCDKPRCCNPKHLFLGTRGENQKDAYAKGRRTRNFFNRSNLSLETVRKIKQKLKAGFRMCDRARTHHVKYHTIANIVYSRNFYWVK